MAELWRFRWLDSLLVDRYVESQDLEPEPVTIVSVGYLVRDADSYVLLARERHSGDVWRGLICIPAFAIVERERLRGDSDGVEG